MARGLSRGEFAGKNNLARAHHIQHLPARIEVEGQRAGVVAADRELDFGKHADLRERRLHHAVHFDFVDCGKCVPRQSVKYQARMDRVRARIRAAA